LYKTRSVTSYAGMIHGKSLLSFSVDFCFMAREFLRKEAVEQEKSHISTAGNFADPQQKLCIGKYRWEEVV